MFRSCTAALSSRTLARCSATRQTCQLVSTRRYSSVETEEATGEKSEPPIPESETALKLKTKEEEVVDLTSRLRYLQADFLNLQRNAAREKEQTRDFAISRFASDLLETADVLALALKSVPQSVLESSPTFSTPSTSPKPETEIAPEAPKDPLNVLYKGVEITHRQLLQTLFKYHVKPFDPTGEKFDPNRHEALYQVPIAGKEPGTVIDCQKVGYTIKDRILRAAQVGVVQETES